MNYFVFITFGLIAVLAISLILLGLASVAKNVISFLNLIPVLLVLLGAYFLYKKVRGRFLVGIRYVQRAEKEERLNNLFKVSSILLFPLSIFLFVYDASSLKTTYLSTFAFFLILFSGANLTYHYAKWK